MGLSGRRVKQRIPADPRNLAWADDAAKFGSNYLSKFGWDASKGLGVEGDGRTSHIKVTQKLDMLGIGAAHQKDPNGIAWKQNKDFENLLKRLNESVQAESSPEEETKENILVEESGTPVDGNEDGKEKKRKRKEKREKSEEKAKKRRKKDSEDEKDDVDLRESLAVDTKATEQPAVTKPFVPRNRAHRARAIASKAIASKSSAHIAEILGVASTPSTSAASGSGTPIGGQLTPLDDTVSLEKLTTSTKSVADYFKEKLLAKSSKSGTQTPSMPLLDTQENDSYDTPRGGLGASRMTSINADEADAEIQRVGLSKFSSLMSSAFLSATTMTPTIEQSAQDSTPLDSDTPKTKKEKRKKESAGDGEEEEERRSKKEKKKRRKAEDGESEEAVKDGDGPEPVVSRKSKKDKRSKDTETENETVEEDKAQSKEERRRLRREKKDRKKSSP